MSANDPFKLLRDNRAALLACEAIGWLHMAGKAHPDFLQGHAKDGDASAKAWKYEMALNSLYCHFGTLSIGGRSVPLRELFEMHAKTPDEDVLGLMQAAHGMASGIEKNQPKNASGYLGQTSDNMWLTTAFGHPVQNLLGTSPPDIFVNHAWTDIETRIGTLIDGLTVHPKNLEEWIAWRDAAIGPSGWLREAFTTTLAETRVPNNDVTLWDQSFITAALFKAAAAGAVLSDSSFEWGNGSKANTQWRVLTIGIGAEHYEARAVRIGDWTGTRAAIAEFFDEVCKFIEVDLAVGACVYRDERTLSFTFPGQRFDNKGSVDDALVETLTVSIEAEVDSLARKYAFETPPLVRLSSSTRSFIAMSRELAKARRILETPVHRPWNIENDSSRGKHVCPVTLVRAGDQLGNGSDRKQDVSMSAYKRRTGRRDDWEKNGGDTIWISEVADENDRVALLTFSLGLEGWLEGTHVDSLRAQSVFEWRANNTSLTTIDLNTPRDSFRTYIEGFIRNPTLQNGKLSDAVLKTLNDGFAHEKALEDFFRKVVEDRADAPKWSKLDDATRAAWLTHQLFRKNASPGRVHRFWRTTQVFFAEALEEFRTHVSNTGGTRTQRLSLTLSGGTNRRAGEVYAGHLPSAPDKPFEFLCRGSDFITVCNLERVLGDDGDASQLKGMRFEARDDGGVRHQFTIDTAVAADGVLASYCPLIVLEENPERFRVLVPLESADACVNHVISKWRKEMARVWDRLPLRIGVIGFPRKMPFQAVIEATRNIEDDLAIGGEEIWRVTQVTAQTVKTTLSFERPDKGCEAVVVPTKLEDDRDDVYYPNLAVVGAERDADLAHQPHDFTAPRPDGSSVVFRWAAELKVGDEVRVTPSRVAYVYLDSTARRFEPVQVHPLSECDRRRTIWEQVGKAARSITAARAVEQSLREARERWTDDNGVLDDAVWSDWVHAVLAIEWSVNEHDLGDLEQAARDGLLERVLSWHLHVLKQKMGATR